MLRLIFLTFCLLLIGCSNTKDARQKQGHIEKFEVEVAFQADESVLISEKIGFFVMQGADLGYYLRILKDSSPNRSADIHIVPHSWINQEQVKSEIKQIGKAYFVQHEPPSQHLSAGYNQLTWQYRISGLTTETEKGASVAQVGILGGKIPLEIKNLTLKVSFPDGIDVPTSNLQASLERSGESPILIPLQKVDDGRFALSYDNIPKESELLLKVVW